MMHHPKTQGWMVPVVKTIASQADGVDELLRQIENHQQSAGFNDKKYYLLTEKVYQLIRQKRMKDINKENIRRELEKSAEKKDFNLYLFASQYKK